MKLSKKIVIGIGFLLIFIQCQNTDNQFEKLTSNKTGISFVNEIQNKEDFNITQYRNFYNGGGVSIGDINNDGLDDIYFTSNQGENKLYLNKGDFKFQDITKKAGVKGSKFWSTGAVMADVNGDGFLDIYVCNAGGLDGSNRENELFINNGNLTFSDEAKKYNLQENGLTTHASFFDYDKDGDLDVYILNNSFIPVNSLNYSDKRDLRDEDWQVPEILKGGGDKLLENDNGVFKDVSEKAGIYGSLIGFGLGVTVSDINNDNYPDIYVCNDFYERDYLYINNQDGTFSEQLQNKIQHTSMSSMGADIADLNNDSYPEIYVTDMLVEDDTRLKESSSFETYDIFSRKLNNGFGYQFMQNSLQLNNEGDYFQEIADYSGISKTDWSWGALLFDMDNDGYKDIFVCNGILQDLTNQDYINYQSNDIFQKIRNKNAPLVEGMPSNPVSNYAFRNNGNLKFQKKTKDWGFEEKTFSNGAAYSDLDNDGDLDLVINNVNSEAGVYQNKLKPSEKNNFLKIKLKGLSPNTFAVGAKIKVYSGHDIISYEVSPARGFQSSMPYTNDRNWQQKNRQFANYLE